MAEITVKRHRPEESDEIELDVLMDGRPVATVERYRRPRGNLKPMTIRAFPSSGMTVVEARAFRDALSLAIQIAEKEGQK